MKISFHRPRILLGLPLLAVVALASLSCSSHRSYQQAVRAEQAGDWDQAVLLYMEAVRRHPQDVAFRSALLRAKIEASQVHFKRGQEFYSAGVLERALIEYRHSVELDPSNQYAQAQLRRVVEDLRELRESGHSALSIAEMKDRARDVQPQPPVLDPRSDEAIDLIFSQSDLGARHLPSPRQGLRHQRPL